MGQHQHDDEQASTSRTMNGTIPAGYNRASTNRTMSEEARAERQTSQHQQTTNGTTRAGRQTSQHPWNDERANTSRTANEPTLAPVPTPMPYNNEWANTNMNASQSTYGHTRVQQRMDQQ